VLADRFLNSFDLLEDIPTTPTSKGDDRGSSKIELEVSGVTGSPRSGFLNCSGRYE